MTTTWDEYFLKVALKFEENKNEIEKNIEQNDIDAFHVKENEDPLKNGKLKKIVSIFFHSLVLHIYFYTKLNYMKAPEEEECLHSVRISSK